jgi:nucleoside-diphosphate-sugar epimerase
MIAEIMDKAELLQIGALAASPDEPPQIIADVSRLTKEVKFTVESDLKQRLLETIDYWRNNL